MADILFFIDVRVYFNSEGKTFAFPLCLTIDNPQDEDLIDKDRFFKYIFNIIEKINDVKSVVYVDINARPKGDNVCELPLWMQTDYGFYFSHGIVIPKERSSVRVIENKGQGFDFIKDYFVFPSGQKITRYGTMKAARNMAIEWFKSMNPDSVNIYVVNSYNQLSELVYYDSINEAFYSVPFPTIVELGLTEKISNLFKSSFVSKFSKIYMSPVFSISYIAYGIWLDIQVQLGILTLEEATNKANSIQNNAHRKAFFFISTVLYIVVAMILVNGK